jgi:hypothetical protein
MFKYLLTIFIAFLIVNPVWANNEVDTDHDGVPDNDEIYTYKTDPLKADTDGDGFSDFAELNSGFSPHNPERVRLEDNDQDIDGLNDRQELRYKTDILNPDTDEDGFKDGYEIAKGFDPLKGGGAKLVKKIKIDLKNQRLSYYQGDMKLGEFPVSTGKRSMPTPKGSFKILNKSPKAWSRDYGLWMPYWLGLGRFGIHELPIWPNGYREGANHLGIPVSHGCIRLGIGPAKTVYNWAEIGTEVIIN